MKKSDAVSIKLVVSVGKKTREDALDEALDLLCKHPDPSVRLCVARDERAGKKRLKVLGRDADPEIAKAAKAEEE